MLVYFLQKSFSSLGLTENPGRSRWASTLAIYREIMKQDGVVGFYRGYTASLCAYVPNSALWWAFYHLYQGKKGFSSSIFYKTNKKYV